MKKDELKDAADQSNVEYPSTANKQELIDLLVAAELEAQG